MNQPGTNPKNIISLLNILLWKGSVRSFETIVIDHNSLSTSQEFEQRLAQKKLINKSAKKSGACIAIEHRCKKRGIQVEVELISLLQTEYDKFYILVDRERDALEAGSLVRHQCLGQVNIYGIRSDYFLSIVPIESPNRRHIEQYILQLRVDPTPTGRIKLLVKKMLVCFGFSSFIFDGFICAVSTNKP